LEDLSSILLFFFGFNPDNQFLGIFLYDISGHSEKPAVVSKRGVGRNQKDRSSLQPAKENHTYYTRNPLEIPYSLLYTLAWEGG